MLRDKRLKSIIIIILVVFITSFPVAFMCMFIKDVPVLSSLFDDYILTGKSIFIQILPNINILWFLPQDVQITYFSIGHLLDIIIIVNIMFYIETNVYHYVKWSSSNEEALAFICKSSNSLRPDGELYVFSKNIDLFYGLSDESEYCFDKKLFNIKKEKRSRKNEGFDIFYDNLNKKLYLAQNELYNRNLEFLFDNRKNYLIFFI